MDENEEKKGEGLYREAAVTCTRHHWARFSGLGLFYLAKIIYLRVHVAVILQAEPDLNDVLSLCLLCALATKTHSYIPLT